jgi:hypothetical protein
LILYRCLIRGENFPGQLIRSKGLVGFYATRFVTAASPDEAEFTALEMLRRDPDFQISSEKLRRQEPPAKVYFDEIVDVDSRTDQTPNSGATWFNMN